jgi:hypothetical protein
MLLLLQARHIMQRPRDYVRHFAPLFHLINRFHFHSCLGTLLQIAFSSPLTSPSTITAVLHPPTLVACLRASSPSLVQVRCAVPNVATVKH